MDALTLYCFFFYFFLKVNCDLYIVCYLCEGGSWWRHRIETFTALLCFCGGNSPVTGEFPTQRPATRSFDVFFDLHLNQELSKQWRRRWFDTPLRSLWCHCNVMFPMYRFGLHWLYGQWCPRKTVKLTHSLTHSITHSLIAPTHNTWKMSANDNIVP